MNQIKQCQVILSVDTQYQSHQNPTSNSGDKNGGCLDTISLLCVHFMLFVQRMYNI